MDIKTQKMLADVVLNAQNKAVKPYTTTATVKSVNNGIVYVEIPGSDRDTPVKNSSVSVKKGDVVDLVVSHDDTHITGNRSDVAVPESTAQKMSQTLEATRLEMDNELDLFDNELDLFNNKIKMVNNSIEMQDNKIEMQNNTITQFGNTIDQQNNIIEQQNNNITEIGNTVNSQGNTITEIGNKVNTQDNTITEIGNMVNSQGNDITELNNTVNTQGNTITEIGNTVNSQGNDITEIGNTIELQDSSIKTLDSTVQTLDSTVKTQGSNIETLGSNVEIINSAFVIQDGKLTGLSEIVTNILKSGYVTTDLLNANVAWIENGKIKESAIGTTEIADASITTAKIDELSADVIKTGTIRTERLILTTDEVDPKTGEKKVALITALNAKVNAGEGNILDGAVIADETIKAAKIDVVDLNAFNATIGNFHIGTSSIYNGKTSLKDPTNGVYLGTDGIALGQGSLLGMTDDSPFRVESDGDFHLGAKDGNYINFNAFTGALDINVNSLKIESSNVAERLNNIDENAIVSQVVEYYPSTSPTSLTGGSWSTSQPTWTEGTYIWSRTKNTNGKGESSYSTPACITGNTGAQGIAGTNGSNGKTSYLHIAYANSSDGTTGFSVSDSTNKLYIGQYTDFTSSDSTDPTKYSWTKIKGDKGNTGATGVGVKSSDVTYQSSTSGTTVPTGTWSPSVPSVSAGSYLWTKTVITYTNNTTTTSYSVGKMGANGTNGTNGTNGKDGADGSDGRGIKSTAVTYQAWPNGTSTPTGTWESSPPATTADKPYLWSKTVLTYTDNTTSTTYSVGSTPEGIKIGGRNLLVGTKDFSGYWDNKKYWSVSSETYKGFTVLQREGVWMGLYQHIEGVVGETYTFSGYVKKTGGNTYVFTDGFGGTTTNNGAIIGTKLNEWEHFSVTTTVSTSGSLGFRVENNSSNETTYLCGLKLEKGNKATDWSPAPEDTEASITEVKTIAEQTADKFSWLVKSGTSATNFELTDRVASLLSERFDIDALTTFKNSAENGTSTVINGGAIDTDSLFAQDITATNMTISGDSKFGNFYASDTIEGLAYENSNYGGVMYLGKIAALIDEDEYGFQLGNGNSMTNIQPGGVFVQSNCGGSYSRKTTIHGGFIETYCISTSQSGGTVSIGSDIVPLYSDEDTLLDITLGSSSKKFADLYTSKFNGTSVNSNGIASTSGYGVTKLSSSYTSSSTSTAANSKAVCNLYNITKTIVTRGVATGIFSSCTYANKRLRCVKINSVAYSMTMFGGVIEVTTGSTAISYQWTPFFQIPEGFRPSTTMQTVVHVFDKDTSRLSVTYAVEIYTDGIVCILGSFVASESFRFVFPCIMYI